MPTLYKDWPARKNRMTTAQIVKMYSEGYKGARYDKESEEKLAAEVEIAQASDVAHSYGFADSGKGRLSAPFIHVLNAYPKAWPGPAQERGSCVLHNGRNVLLGTLCAEVVAGLPDEVSGKREGFPKVSAVAEKNGVLAIEPGYWLRGHSGDGYSCPANMRDMTNTIGAVLRKDYPELDINLEELDSKLAGKYHDKSQVPKQLLKGFGKNLIRSSTFADEMEEVRDLLWQDFFFSTCGSEGFSNKRDAHGVSSRKGRWAHAMAYIGFDDRPVVYGLYGEPLVLILNSWGTWNKGPREIVDSAKLVPKNKKEKYLRKNIVSKDSGNILIPKGSFWSRWSDVRNRTMIAAAGLEGWGRTKVDWSFEVR